MSKPPYLRKVVISALLTSFAFSLTPAVANADSVNKNIPSNSSKAVDPSQDAGEKRYIVKYKNHVNSEEKSKGLLKKGLKVKNTLSHALKASVVVATPAQIDELKKSADVDSIEVDQPVYLDEATSVWGIDRVDQRTGRDGQYTITDEGAGVNIYVVDTGVYTGHTDFSGRILPGWTGINDGKGVNDCDGHGTHVAGSAAGTQAGVAKKANIIPVRVFGCSGESWVSTLASGLDWITENHAAGQPAVVNMSLGGFKSTMFEELTQDMVDDGLTVVVSAGNSNIDACDHSPFAKVPSVLTVAATDPNDIKSYFSNYGPCVDIHAPGSYIRSAGIASPTSYLQKSGTSMAAPHVAGAAAVTLSRNKFLTPSQVSEKIVNEATNDVITENVISTPNKLLFVSPKPPAFTDLEGNAFVKEITWMKTQGITNGYSDGTYRPYEYVNREQMAAFLYRMAGSPTYTPPSVSPFTDIPTSHYFYKEIAWMNSAGISTGWSDKTYRPSETVLRESMAVFMQRYSNKVCSVNISTHYSFTDANTSIFSSQINWMGGAGISTGYPDGTYRPFDSVSRESMAAFMYRLNDHINTNGGCKA